MRIGELSRRSGVPVPTIKFYVREGLVPAGDRTKANQAEYGDEHVRRLGLVRALLEVGGLPVRTARRVLDHLDTPGVAPLTAIGKAQYALLTPDPEAVPDPASGPGGERSAEWARRVDDLLARWGWEASPNNPARAALAEALAAIHHLGLGDVRLDRYAQVVAEIAELDVALALDRPTRDEVAERVVLWTVLGDRVLIALRRLADESIATHRLAGPPG